ncbi:MAG: GGDEF domain-containing protein [Clostridia bacterium]
MTIQAATYLELNLFGMAILILILYNTYKRHSNVLMADQRLFRMLVIANTLLLLFDTGISLLNGTSFLLSYSLHVLCTASYYILSHCISFIWLLYTEYKINNDRCRVKKYFMIYLIPVTMGVLLSLVSIFTKWFFYIDENNVYQRGPLLALSIILSYSYLILTIMMLIMKLGNAKAMPRQRKMYLALMTFPLIPVTGGMIQMFVPYLSLVWICSIGSFFIIFIEIQNSQIFTDFLTGLNNRRQLIAYFMWKMKRLQEGKTLIAVLLDIDNFKNINDNYGHIVGDNALVQAAEILKKSCTKDEFLVRYGGDEFLILYEIGPDDTVMSLINVISDNTDDFNGTHDLPYSIRFSVGCSAWKEEKNDTFECFINRADRNMYEDKCANLQNGK